MGRWLRSVRWRNLSVACGVAATCFAATLASPVAAGDAALGEYLSSECVTCHQPSGHVSGIPSIVSWPEDQFIAVLTSYKAKVRDNPVMQTIAGRLDEDEIAALAAYFGKLPAQANTQ